VSVTIRDEQAGDEAAIRAVIERAFAGTEHSDGTEADILDRLRADPIPLLSLVAIEAEGMIIGHIAFSPVTISDGSAEWWGLGPLAVLPGSQRHGIGRALVEMGIARLCEHDAAGCVVLGDPAYYARFGFAHDPGLAFPAAPSPFFQRIIFAGATPQGIVSYAAAFG